MRDGRLSKLTLRLGALLAAACACALYLGVAVEAAWAGPPPNTGSWTMIFDEEFNSSGLNTSVWTPGWQHGGISGPMSGQCLNSSYVSQPGDGSLHLAVRQQNNTCGTQQVTDTGSLVESNPSDGVAGHSGFAYSYGYVEWRTYVTGYQSHLADWPGLWSVPAGQSDNHTYEYDTMEGLGEKEGHPCAGWHYFPPLSGELQEGEKVCGSSSWGGAWHTYGLDWEPGGLTYYYDGSPIRHFTPAHMTSLPNYLIMQMVPPYIYEPHGVGWIGGERVVPAEMLVDYVRVWRHPTSPSVAIAPDGNFELAARASTSGLWTMHGPPGGALGTWVGREMLFGMAPGTSPSVAIMPDGTFELAAQSTTGELWTLHGTPGGELGTWVGRNMQFGMQPTSSPSVTAMPDGTFELAAQTNTGELWTMHGPPGGALGTWVGRNMVFGMRPTSSPSVTAMPDGTFELAAQTNKGELWTLHGTPGGELGTWVGRNMLFGMMRGSSPSVAAVPDGTFELAAQTDKGELWTLHGTPGGELGIWVGRNMLFGM